MVEEHLLLSVLVLLYAQTTAAAGTTKQEHNRRQRDGADGTDEAVQYPLSCQTRYALAAFVTREEGFHGKVEAAAQEYKE